MAGYWGRSLPIPSRRSLENGPTPRNRPLETRSTPSPRCSGRSADNAQERASHRRAKSPARGLERCGGPWPDPESNDRRVASREGCCCPGPRDDRGTFRAACSSPSRSRLGRPAGKRTSAMVASPRTSRHSILITLDISTRHSNRAARLECRPGRSQHRWVSVPPSERSPAQRGYGAIGSSPSSSHDLCSDAE